MPLQKMDFISREFVRENTASLFVFGDNLEGKGFGGQAAEMRGEWNVVGIVTKRRPNMRPDAFLTDADFPTVFPLHRASYGLLLDHLMQGRTIVFPTNGVGTGRARLERSAPKIWESLCLFNALLNLADFTLKGGEQ